jgi:hypothetical protein
MDSSGDEEWMNSMIMDFDEELLLVKIMFEASKTTTRNFKWEHSRLNWEEALEKERHQDSFESKYHIEHVGDCFQHSSQCSTACYYCRFHEVKKLDARKRPDLP